MQRVRYLVARVLQQRFASAFSDARVDVLVMPTTPMPALLIDQEIVVLPGGNGQCQAPRRSGWAAGLGFEPRQHAPEARGLPLPHPARVTPDSNGSRSRIWNEAC